MKAKLLTLILLFASYCINAQLTFQKTYGGIKQDYCYDMHKTFDGGYVLGGITFSYPSPYGKSYVVKTDVNGDTLWTASYGDTCSNGFQYINDLSQTIDGGYVTVGGKRVCGDPNPTGNGEICRLDANGNVVWAKRCVDYEDPYPVIQSRDGNFIVGGYTTGIGAGGQDGCIMKLDKNGDTLWSRTYGGVGDDWFYHIIQTKDGGYLAAGKTTSFGQGGTDIYLVKTDSNGNLMWSKAYGTAADEFAFGHCLDATADGGYILTGQEGNSSQSATGIFLLKIDSVGNMKWVKYFSGEWAHGVKQTYDKGYIIAGNGNYTTTADDVVLIKTDSMGALQWGKTYGGNGGESGWLLDIANDGGYVTGGYTTSFGSGNEDMYLIKTDINGNSNCNETSPVISISAAPFISTNPATKVYQGTNTTSYALTFQRGATVSNLCTTVGITENKPVMKSMDITPNPVTNNAIISFEEDGIRSIGLYDVTGRELSSFESVIKEYTFSCTGLSTGIYFIKATSEKRTEVIKFIKR